LAFQAVGMIIHLAEDENHVISAACDSLYHCHLIIIVIIIIIIIQDLFREKRNN
jgi:hypothetical protein